MLKYNKKNIKKILILKNDKIGDMIVSSGFIREIRKAYPQAKITLIASEANRNLIEKSNYYDKMLTLNYTLTNYKEFKDFLKMALKLRRDHFDLGIDLRGSIYNIFFLLFLAGVKIRAGMYNRDLSRIFLNGGIKKDRSPGNHCIFLRLRLMNEVLGIKTKNYWPSIITTKEDKKTLDEVLSKNDLQKKRYICIIPDASYPEKQWPFEQWDSLIKYIQSTYPKYKIVVTGGDMEKLSWFKKRNPTIKLLKTHLRAASLLFKNSNLVIAQDGGPMHMAWASKTKVIAIIAAGRIPVHYFKPLGKNADTVAAYVKKLKFEEVIPHVNKALKKN
ncbi:glycosyltransferase family 9 protein [Candidatus Pacearchaeota archaeon]|nr:glycosyltransferase family 9 protein [Candidatus Pacearchaeota archaeon]